MAQIQLSASLPSSLKPQAGTGYLILVAALEHVRAAHQQQFFHSDGRGQTEWTPVVITIEHCINSAFISLSCEYEPSDLLS